MMHQNLVSDPDAAQSEGMTTPYRVIALGLLLYGLLPRLTQLGSGRALWHDESLLAVNAVERSYLALLAPLDYL